MVNLGLENFVKTITVKEFHDQNERLKKIHHEEERNIPEGACFDKYHNMYVPYGSHFYQRMNDPRLILYRKGSQRRVKIREKGNNQWDVELTINREQTLLNMVKISHSGLGKESQRIIKDSIKKIIRKIPIYKYYNDYSFTQAIPPIKRKKIRPLSFHTLLLFPDRLKVHGGTFYFKKQLKQELIKGLRHGFHYSSLMQSYYEQRVMVEETDDSQKTEVHIERIKEDRINFGGFVPLFEVIRAIKSIYDENFSTAKDQSDFAKLVRNIILTSSEFIMDQKEFSLGYADIQFAQCFIPTKRYFPYWKQTICKFTPVPVQTDDEDYDIEDESYSSWISESDYGQTIFVKGELLGMENYHEVSIDVIRLKPKDEEREEEISEEKEKMKVDQQEPVIASSSDPVVLLTEKNDACGLIL